MAPGCRTLGGLSVVALLVVGSPGAAEEPTSMPAADAEAGDMGQTLMEQLDWFCAVFSSEIEDRTRPIGLRLGRAQSRVEDAAEGTALASFLESLPRVDGDRYAAFVDHAAAHGVPAWSCPSIERAVAMMEAGDDDRVLEGGGPEGAEAADYVRMCDVADAVLSEDIQPEWQLRTWAERVDLALQSAEARRAFEAIVYADPSVRREMLELAAVEAGLDGFTCEAWGPLFEP